MSKISQTIATLDPKKRALLAALLKEQGVEASRVVILPAPRGAGAFPLSFAQERLWFLDRLWPGDTSYNLPAALRLSGPLDAGVLGRVFPEIARRHETLRTRFVEREGRPFQAIEPAVDLPLPVIDLAALEEERREAETRRLASAHATWPFDLGKAPLLRVTLLRLAAESHVLLFNVHHIISDGWSFGVLNREVGELYESLAQGRVSSQGALPALEIQYVDYAVWQRDLLQGAELERQVGYWRDKLAGAPPVLELPLDRPRSADPSGQGGQAFLILGPEIREGLAALARQSGATLFMVLLAAFAVLLRRHAGDAPDDVVLGT
ncbi:MAG TPA: condensation domain-containing protein, partial [Thermoanaerobaculia bacterium]|nr:condensation domain-containing protein [Thermoanaerobaculia bacterium]